MSRFIRQESPRHFDDCHKYRPYLQRDFRQVCAYCERSEAYLGGEDFFEVDHFRPHSKFPLLETDYLNLYYACRKCNQHKGNSWPADSLFAKGFRFADPCEEDMYAEHLRAGEDVNLQALSNCGKYTCDHIRLNRPDLLHWRREKRQFTVELPILENLKDELEALLRAVTEDHVAQEELHKKLAALESTIVRDRQRFSL